MFTRYLFVSIAAFAFTGPAFAQPDAKAGPNFTRTEDVIYGRRDGLALTMDVFAPKEKPNGKGIIVCVSAEFRSSRSFLLLIEPLAVKQLVDRGYVVFAVMHGSQPRYTVPDIVEDIHRAVRFIKANAKKYDVDPKKLGITGASSGGHLALMMGCACKPGRPGAADKVDQESSAVAAVACFFPVTDFLEFDRPNLPKNQEAFRALFDVREFDPKTNRLERVTPERRTELGKLNSPLHCATKTAVPTLIVHGDKDTLVPIDQSRKLIAKLTDCEVACELVVKEGKAHGWLGMEKDVATLADWFDKHLK
jgi:acetyl esterase/lipase